MVRVSPIFQSMYPAHLLAIGSPVTAIGIVLGVAVLGLALVTLLLQNPALAAFVLLGAMFFRLALPQLVVADPFLFAYVAVIASVVIWGYRHRADLLGPGMVETAMVLYLLCSYGSMVLPHEYQAVDFATDGGLLDVGRFILISTLIPFTMYLVGRYVFDRIEWTRQALWVTVFFGAYSAAVSIGQFHAPSLVWPRYIVDAPNWEERANGVLNQPVANGIVLITAFAATVALASSDREPRWRRDLLWILAAIIPYAVYLTHTRATYLAFVAMLVLGAVLATGARRAFVVSLVLLAVGAAASWSTLSSSDRASGGVGSTSEIYDRLNNMATSLWAFHEKPLFGWGIGRFVAVNTNHHQQWSTDTPWIRGYGFASHFNEFGILAELGIIGLGLWLCVLIPITWLLISAYRSLPATEINGKILAFVALSAFTAQAISGTTVDLRLFDFSTALVLLLVGMAIGERDRLLRITARRSLWTMTVPRAVPTAEFEGAA
jgi:O-antigen ligase